MAKVKGPLMSMDARGQLGKTLVFLGWKGLKTVRSHVVPANPQTGPQQAQRGIMGDAVASFHSFEFNEFDRTALNVLASIQAKIMSGFNVFCKKYIDNILLEFALVIPWDFTVVANTAGNLSLSLAAVGTTAASVRYGLSPTVMSDSASCTKALTGDPYTVTLTGMTAGSYVFVQLYTEVAETYVLSGIYKVLILA